MNNIETIKFKQFKKQIKDNKKEGIVLLGAGGDLNEWIDGVSDQLQEEKIANGSKETMWEPTYYKMETTGDRVDLAMLFKENTTLDIGKMAMWRLRFGDCSWINDYLTNFKDHH